MWFLYTIRHYIHYIYIRCINQFPVSLKEILFITVRLVVLRRSCSIKMAELSENYKINGP